MSTVYENLFKRRNGTLSSAREVVAHAENMGTSWPTVAAKMVAKRKMARSPNTKIWVSKNVIAVTKLATCCGNAWIRTKKQVWFFL
jgi:hypothetical protein